jgi:carbon starvation protein
MIQDLVGNVVPKFRSTESWANNLIGSAIACACWGWFLYQGVIDPLGGIWTLWPLFGTANQMLAAIALTMCTVVLFKMKRERYAFVTIIPATWLVVCTVTAGVEKVFSANPAVGFLAHATRFSDAAAAGKLLAPAKTLEEMHRVAFNDYVDATLAAVFATIVVIMVVYGVLACIRAMANPRNTALEIGMAASAGDD